MRLCVLVFALAMAPSVLAESSAADPGSVLIPENIDYQHAYAFLAEPAQSADYPHFSYVNPEAPKGGTLRITDMGNWDNFNNVNDLKTSRCIHYNFITFSDVEYRFVVVVFRCAFKTYYDNFKVFVFFSEE